LHPKLLTGDIESMAKTSKPKRKPKPISPEVANLDLDPNAWSKFEKLVKSAAKMGPKPHK
jgi:hypothetical protein